jgi:hypothetical protein
MFGISEDIFVKNLWWINGVCNGLAFAVYSVINDKIKEREHRRREHERVNQQHNILIDQLLRQQRAMERYVREKEVLERATKTQGQVISPKDPYGEEDWEN